MTPFVYKGLPANVIFGFDTLAQLPQQLALLDIKAPLILTTPAQQDLGQTIADDLASSLSGAAAGLFGNAAMHTPIAVTEQALEVYENTQADGIISVGGGSTIGLGKAIALRNDAPQIAIPTTYAGSEMTTIIGQTEDGLKTTQKTLRVLPETVIYDVNLTLSLPAVMSVTSGLNAIAHAVEAMYAEQANPLLSSIAETGIEKLMGALAQIVSAQTSPQTADADQYNNARYEALYGAWLCAICLGTGGVALHHKLCHVLGGSFDLPHAETHTVMLPQALAFNAAQVPAVMERLRRATGSDNPAAALWDIAERAGAPTALKDLGMPQDGIDKAVGIALKNPYYNPRAITESGIRQVISAAWSGSRPT